MTAVQIAAAVERNQTVPVVSPVVQNGVQAVGGIEPQGKSLAEIQAILAQVHGISATGVEDGTRIHIHYKAMGKPTAGAILCAARASELGLPRDRYTGRVHRIWNSKAGDLCLTLWVELERDHMYRTINLVRGTVFQIVVLGN